MWEVATYGKAPFSKVAVNDIIEMASNGSLKLTRYVYIVIYIYLYTDLSYKF